MSETTPSALVEALTDPNFRGPMQHLRSWQELDALHDAAAAFIRSTMEAVETDVMKEARFLIARLGDWEREHGPDVDGDAYSDWSGHVVPSIARLRTLTGAPDER